MTEPTERDRKMAMAWADQWYGDLAPPTGEEPDIAALISTIAEAREEERVGHAETQANALAWMRAHDVVASWIQADPATLKRWIEHPPPDHKLPKPADLPEMVAAAREEERERCAEIARAWIQGVPTNTKNRVVREIVVAIRFGMSEEKGRK